MSVEDARDVAAYFESQARPARLQKPVDIGYGPYGDGFSQTRHRLRPFGPIEQKAKEPKAQKGSHALKPGRP